jgi:hypothetical protein
MSSNNAVQTNAAAAAQDPAVTPEAIVEQLRVMREQIPEFVQLPPADAKSIQPVASVHPEFAQAAINAIAAAPLGTDKSVCAHNPTWSNLDKCSLCHIGPALWPHHFVLTIPLRGCLSVILTFSAASATCV